MIEQFRKEPPFLHFGFGLLQTPDIDTGVPVDIWQDTVYNPALYTIGVTAPGATIIQSSLGHIRLQFATSGIKSISVTIENTDKTISLESNSLSLGVK